VLYHFADLESKTHSTKSFSSVHILSGDIIKEGIFCKKIIHRYYPNSLSEMTTYIIIDK
jgi:hypothetical protein